MSFLCLAAVLSAQEKVRFDGDFAPPAGWGNELFAIFIYDKNVEVYLNGELALKRGGHINRYERFDVKAGLRKGKNTLAVHSRQTAGGQYIDVGLGVKTSTTVKKEHNLLHQNRNNVLIKTQSLIVRKRRDGRGAREP